MDERSSVDGPATPPAAMLDRAETKPKTPPHPGRITKRGRLRVDLRHLSANPENPQLEGFQAVKPASQLGLIVSSNGM